MIEKVKYKKKLYALIIKNEYKNKKGIHFFTEDHFTQQIGYMSHNKGHIILPHRHIKRITKILVTTETILILKGLVRVDFYDNKKKYLFSKLLKSGEIIFLMHGGHGFKILKPTKMLEIKQGPFNFHRDKIKFKNIDEKKIKIRK